jgi:hypothetical protein
LDERHPAKHAAPPEAHRGAQRQGEHQPGIQLPARKHIQPARGSQITPPSRSRIAGVAARRARRSASRSREPAEYFDLIATLWGGIIFLRTAMLFALAFMAQFLIGGLTGILLGSPPLNYDVHNTYFIVGHFHYTLLAGSVFAFFAASITGFPRSPAHCSESGWASCISG